MSAHFRKRTLEVCSDNLSLGTREVLDVLKGEFRDLEIKEWRCVGNCHRCFRAPFVLLDETDLIDAPNAPQLLAKLRSILLSSG